MPVTKPREPSRSAGKSSLPPLCENPFLKREVSHPGSRSASCLGRGSGAACQRRASRGSAAKPGGAAGLPHAAGGAGGRRWAGGCGAVVLPSDLHLPAFPSPGTLHSCTRVPNGKMNARNEPAIFFSQYIACPFCGLLFYFSPFLCPFFAFMVLLLAGFPTQSKASRFSSCPKALKPDGQDGISAKAVAGTIRLYVKITW